MKPRHGMHLHLISATVQTDRVLVTPELARKWLATTLRNRIIRRVTVLTYSADMRAGQWVFTGDPVRFDRDGHLIDGQHRLSALAAQEESLALEFLVVLGLPPETQLSMDQGRKRTSGQQLDLHGYRHSNALAAGIRMLLTWEADRLFTRAWDEEFAATSAAIMEWAEEHPDQVEKACDLYRRVRSIGWLPGVGMTFALRVSEDYPDLVTDFYTDLDELVNQPKGSPLLTLTRRLHKARVEKMKLTNIDQLAFTITTWNAWTDNRKLHKLIRPAGGEWTQATFPELDL